MNRKVDLVTIHKYLSGQLSDPEVARFEDEMSKDEALRTAVEDVRSALAAAGEYQTPAWNVDDALSSMPFAPSNAVVSRTDNNKRIRMRAWVASAAAVALLLVAGLMIVRSYVTTEILTYEGTAAHCSELHYQGM